MLLPIKYLELPIGSSVLHVSNAQVLTEDFLKDASIVWWCRECPFDLDQILDLRKKYNFKILVDIDDYWRLPNNHILTESWAAGKTGERMLRAIECADLVTTTHEYLRDKIHKYNKNVEILSNALPYDSDQFTADKVDINNIVYSAGITHLEDLKSLKRFFELSSQNQDIQKYAFCLAGFSGSNKHTLDTWVRMEKEALKFGNYKRWNSLPLDLYMRHYQYAKIAIAPLEDNEFNRCKSFLKGLESGCKYIPLLAPDMHPYNQLPVVICKTQRDWYTNLKELIRNPDLLEARGRELGNYVRENYNLKRINDIRKDIFKQLGSY